MRETDHFHAFVIGVVADLAMMRVDVALDIVGRRVHARFGDFFFEQGDRLRCFGRGDHAAIGFLAEQVEDALGMLLVHRDFGSCFGGKGD